MPNKLNKTQCMHAYMQIYTSRENFIPWIYLLHDYGSHFTKAVSMVTQADAVIKIKCIANYHSACT